MSLADAKELITVGSTIEKKVVRYTPGLAWAAKRSIFANHGFYDVDIVGNGDALMAAALLGQHEPISKRYSLKEPRRQHYFRWAIPFNKSVGGRVGHVAGAIFHLKQVTLRIEATSNARNASQLSISTRTSTLQ